MSTRLKLRLASREDFAKHNEGQRQLFVPTNDPPAIGELVTLEVAFANGPRVIMRGTTQWRRATGDARARPGVGVRADVTESAKIHFLEGYARGGLIDVREKRRLPVRLRVVYFAAGGQRVSFTRDLNEEGAFVRTSEPLDTGKETLLRILPPEVPGFPSVSVHASVVRRQAERTDKGVGVKFVFATPDEKAQFQDFYTRLEEAYLNGSLPESALL